MESFLMTMQQIGMGSILTIKLFFITILFSLPLGLILTFLYTGKNIILKKITGIYILIMRGTPLLLQIFFVYYGLPYMPGVGKYLAFEGFTAATIAFILNYAAYFAEIYRGGLLSIDNGQYEASNVLGLTAMQTKFKVILPQMFRVSLPAISNEAIILVKDTALVTALGLADILHVTKGIVNRTTNITAYFFAGGLYLLMSYLLTILFRKIEKKASY